MHRKPQATRPFAGQHNVANDDLIATPVINRLTVIEIPAAAYIKQQRHGSQPFPGILPIPAQAGDCSGMVAGMMLEMAMLIRAFSARRACW